LGAHARKLRGKRVTSPGEVFEARPFPKSPATRIHSGSAKRPGGPRYLEHTKRVIKGRPGGKLIFARCNHHGRKKGAGPPTAAAARRRLPPRRQKSGRKTVVTAPPREGQSNSHPLRSLAAKLGAFRRGDCGGSEDFGGASTFSAKKRAAASESPSASNVIGPARSLER